MSTLETLIKVVKTRVDEQRQVVARLAERVDALERALVEHHARQEQESRAVATDPAVAMTYGAFLRRSVDEARDLESQRQKAAEALEVAHAKLTEIFEEQKRYELTEKNRRDAERAEQARRERATLDEVGQTGFLRSSQEE